jgi:hypothetical protein
VLTKRLLGIAIIFFIASIGFTMAAYAGTTVPDDIKMEAPYKHRESILVFTHRKHIDEYKIACGECHHDDKGKPLTNLKEGDDVKPCFDCHNKPGELKGRKARGLSKEEKLAYQANAVHENCIDCHRKYNRENKTKAAPQTCKDCHPKKRK